ncbi:unnamed protein product, partial [Effrenium voratum]
MEAQVVALEVKAPFAPFAARGSGLALALPGSSKESALVLTTCQVRPGSWLAVGSGGAVVEAQLVASLRLRGASEAFRSLSVRGWRCGDGLQLHLLRADLHLQA